MKYFLACISAFGLWCSAVSCSAGTAQEVVDTEWPLEFERGDSRILLYELQPESLSGNELSARAAVSISKGGDSEPIFGALWLEARIATDRDARTVTLLDVTVPSVSFPAASASEREELAETVGSELSRQNPTFPLDRLIATLDPAVQAEPLAADLRNDPPRILFVSRPTALVTIDGEPQLREVEGSQLMRVVNTPFILLFDPGQKTYYLNAGANWRRADDLEGPWQVEPRPPSAVKSALPKPPSGSELGAPSSEVAEDVDVLVVREPTELVVSDGEARWTPLEGNDLLYLANSENDAFLESATHTYYVLLSGRWYSSSKLDGGSWKHVAADRLPKAFAKIPADSAKADVRTFVAGTSEAREAVLDASIPQTTAIKRSDAQCSVSYDGDPRFEPIAGTKLRYAVNTASSVIECEGKFYCCSEAVWYVSVHPTGPWAVCVEVPGEVYAIPPSCPIYPVRYVYVYDSTPDYVWVGYLPGYTGCYVAGPTIVYGTGYWHHGWVGSVYYPYPWTWGFCPHYDPWFCTWSFGFGFGWGVSPWWFGHSCGWGHPGWWGAGGFHTAHFEISGTVVTRSVSPKKSLLSSADGPTGRGNLYNRETNRGRLASVSRVEQRGKRTATVPNDVFADREGRVMRRTPKGWEEQLQARGKSATPAPTTRPSPGPAEGRVPRAPTRESTIPERRPSLDRPFTPQARSPGSRPLPFYPRQNLHPTPSPGESFERMREARERGRTRSSILRQRPGASRGKRGG